jgi:hypothetical protein
MQFTVGGIVKPSLAMVLPRGRETIANACGLDDATRQASEECYPILNQARFDEPTAAPYNPARQQ